MVSFFVSDKTVLLACSWIAIKQIKQINQKAT